MQTFSFWNEQCRNLILLYCTCCIIVAVVAHTESSIIASDLSDSSNESLLLSSGGSNRNALNDDNEEMASLRQNDAQTKRKRTGMSARERNLRRLESNERERLRMHGLNAAFEVIPLNIVKRCSRPFFIYLFLLFSVALSDTFRNCGPLYRTFKSNESFQK